MNNNVSCFEVCVRIVHTANGPKLVENNSKRDGIVRLRIVIKEGQELDENAFHLNDVQCKALFDNENQITVYPDVTIKQGKWEYNTSKQITTPDQFFIWNQKLRKWEDLLIMERQFVEKWDTNKNEIREKYIEKLTSLGIGKNRSKRLLNNLTFQELDEYIVWYDFLKTSQTSIKFAKKIGYEARSGQYISKSFGVTCNSLKAAAFALRDYAKEFEKE